MSQPFLLIGLFVVGLAFNLAFGPRKDAVLCAVTAFLSGLALLGLPAVLLAATPLGAGPGTAIAVLVAALAVSAVGLRRFRPEPGQPLALAIATIVFAVAVLGLACVGSSDAGDATTATAAAATAPIAFAHAGALTAVLSAAVDGNLHALAPTVALSLIALFALLCWRGLGARGQATLRSAVAIGIVAAAMTSTYMVAYHAFYLGGSLASAAFLLGFVGLFWLAEAERSSSHLAIAFLWLTAFAVHQPEGPLFGAVFVAVTALPSSLVHLRPHVAVHAALVSAIYVAMALGGDGAAFPPLYAAVVLAINAALIAAWKWRGRIAPGRAGDVAARAIAAVVLAVAIVGIALRPGGMFESLFALVRNLSATRDGMWGYAWYVLALLALLSRAAPPMPSGKMLSRAVLFGFGVIAAIGAFQPGEFARDDAANRMALTLFPLATLYLALTFLPLLDAAGEQAVAPKPPRWQVRALATLSLGDRKIVLFPLRAFGYLAVGAVLLLAVAFVFDRIVLPGAAARSLISSPAWDEEQYKIRKGRRKVWLDPVLFTPMHSVSKEKTTPMRILVMGDSFVAAKVYANFNDVWWRRLERELHRRGYDGIEVISSGNSGWSTRQQLEQARLVIPAYKPDLVIWGYVTNDPDERMIKQAHRSEWRNQLLSEDPWLKWLTGEHFPNLSYQLGGMRRTKLLYLPSPPGVEPSYEYGEWELMLLKNQESFARYRKTLGEVAQLMQESGLPYFFVTLPNSPDQAYFAPRYVPIVLAMIEHGITMYDILPRFISEYTKEKFHPFHWAVTPADGHPGVMSTSYYARAVADILEKRYRAHLPRRLSPPPAPALRVNDWLPARVKLSQTGDAVDIQFPGAESGTRERMLTMPDGDPYLQVALAEPVDLAEIEISCRIKCTVGLGYRIDEEGERVVHRAVYKPSAKKMTWTAAELGGGRNIDMLHIWADFHEPPRNFHPLTMQFRRAK